MPQMALTLFSLRHTKMLEIKLLYLISYIYQNSVGIIFHCETLNIPLKVSRENKRAQYHRYFNSTLKILTNVVILQKNMGKYIRKRIMEKIQEFKNKQQYHFYLGTIYLNGYGWRNIILIKVIKFDMCWSIWQRNIWHDNTHWLNFNLHMVMKLF